MELMIPLSSQDPRPLYEQIYQYIKGEIRNGGLKPMKKLPSSRELAKSLRVSRSTTQSAYEQLVAEGYLEASSRRGYFVAGLDGILPPVSPESRAVQELSLGTAGMGRRRISRRKNGEWIFHLRGIHLESFPFSTWRRISRAVLKEEDTEMFLKRQSPGGSSSAGGHPGLPSCSPGRKLSRRIRSSSAPGNEYLLILLSQLLGRETGIAMEDPTYKQAYRVLGGMGHPVFPVGMDDSGFRVQELEAGSCIRSLCDAVPSVSHGDRHAGEAEAGAAGLGHESAGPLSDRGRL